MSNEVTDAEVVSTGMVQGQTGLARAQSTGLSYQVPEDSEDAGIYAKGRNFLPQIVFGSSGSKAVKSKLMPSEHFALKTGKEKFEDLGATFMGIPQAWRFCASMNLKDSSSGKNLYTAYYDKNSAEYAAVKKVVDDADGKDRSHFYGQEVLFWLVELGRYGILSFNNKTNRNVFPQIYTNGNANRMGRPTVMGSQLISNDKGDSWLGYTVGNYAGVVDPSQMPSDDDFQTASAMFPLKGMTTSVQEVEGVETVPAASAAGGFKQPENTNSRG